MGIQKLLGELHGRNILREFSIEMIQNKDHDLDFSKDHLDFIKINVNVCDMHTKILKNTLFLRTNKSKQNNTPSWFHNMIQLSMYVEWGQE